MNKLTVLFFTFVLMAVAAGARAECTLQLKIDGAIGPASLDFLQRGMAKAERDGCGSLLLLVNTPGGSLQTTRLIVEEILNSPLPVLCLVHPQGGHAGSAGAIILQACHVSGAMETTNMGAATPIMATGQEIAEDLRKKMMNDTQAWVEGLAALRGRNKQFAREIVTEAKSVEAQEALKLKAIDAVPKDIEEFLRFAKDRTVQFSQGKTGPVSVGPVADFSQDTRFKVLEVTTDPQFAYLIFMGSLGLLYFELTHPGMILPGVVGGIGLIVSLVSFHKLNVDWAGVLLIVLGLVLMLAEAFMPAFGALGIGGMASFIFGGLLLFKDNPGEMQLPLGLILIPSLVLGAIALIFGRMAYKSFTGRRRESLDIYRRGQGVVKEINEAGTEGLLEILGETWKFKSSERLQVNDQVEIVAQTGLTLRVKKRT